MNISLSIGHMTQVFIWSNQTWPSCFIVGYANYVLLVFITDLNICLSEIINIWVTLEILETLTTDSLFKVKPTIFFISTLERVTALCPHLDELIGFHSTFSVFVW